MSETTLIWLFGVVGAWLLVVTGGLFKMWVTMVRFETMLVMTSKKAAEVLHSPDDHHQMDKLLEKYIYRSHELSFEEWTQLRDKCDNVHTNKNNTPLERFLAGFLSEVSKHKIVPKLYKG